MNLQSFTREHTWAVEEIPVLQARVCLPEPEECGTRIARRIRRYYQLQYRSWLKYCKLWLLPQAEAAYRRALAASAPLPCFQAELTFRITYQDHRLLSLYTQSREQLPSGRPLVIRRGDTWDLTEGYPLPLSAFFPPRSPWRRELPAFAAEELQRRSRAGLAPSPADWRRRLRRHFNPMNYYLTGEGLTFFYPMNCIAPAGEDLPAFALPWGHAGLQLPFPPENSEKPPS